MNVTLSKNICLLLLLATTNMSFAQQKNKPQKFRGYLFVYFTGNGSEEEAIRADGLQFRALNSNNPVLSSKGISSTGGVRDPHILQGIRRRELLHGGDRHGFSQRLEFQRAMILLKSTDLIHWTSSVVNIQKRFPGNDSLLRVWAPQTIYDPQAKKYVVYFP